MNKAQARGASRNLVALAHVTALLRDRVSIPNEQAAMQLDRVAADLRADLDAYYRNGGN